MTIGAIELASVQRARERRRTATGQLDRERPDAAFRRELVSLLPRLRRFGYSLTRSHDESDDLVQAACERALLRFRQWQTGSRLDSWVYRIMHSIWKNELRARRVRLNAASLQLEEDVFPRHDRSTERHLVLREIFVAVMGLPEAQRATVVLVYVEGFSYKEAAEILQVPIGTVMSRLARGRLTLAARFDDARAAPRPVGV